MQSALECSLSTPNCCISKLSAKFKSRLRTEQIGIQEGFSKVLPKSNFRNGGIKRNWSKISIIFFANSMNNWRPPSLSELTPMIINMGLTHLAS